MKVKKNVLYVSLTFIILIFFIKSLSNNIQERHKKVYQFEAFTGYGTLDNLKKNSDIIVMGSVSDITIDITEDDDIVKSVNTISDFKINYIIRGNEESIDNLKIVQPGGIYNNTTYITPGVNFLEKGSEYIVFLNKLERDPNYYKLINPMQGQIKIVNGKLNLEADEFIEMKSSIFIDGMDKDEFIEKLEPSIDFDL